MSIKEDFSKYIDGNGLYAPAPVIPGTVRASDNGPMFSSEVAIILSKHNELTTQDLHNYIVAIESCVGPDNNLHRAPGDVSPDEVDDYYATYSAHVTLGIRPTFSLPLRLYRQPQLLYASLQAKYPLMAMLFSPILVPITALIIATSCIGVDPSDTDSRRLCWHLIQATKSNLWCRLASYVWFHRLTNDYGGLEMNYLAGMYYEPKGLNNNPYSKWWVTR